jgi:hypothetical protein
MQAGMQSRRQAGTEEQAEAVSLVEQFATLRSLQTAAAAGAVAMAAALAASAPAVARHWACCLQRPAAPAGLPRPLDNYHAINTTCNKTRVLHTLAKPLQCARLLTLPHSAR